MATDTDKFQSSGEIESKRRFEFYFKKRQGICTTSPSFEGLYGMHFDLAIEDSPAAFEHVMHFERCKVAVFDRPWKKNRISK